MLYNLYFLLGAPASSGANAEQGSSFMSLIPFVAIFFIMYFLMIRPQQKRQKAQQNMLANIKKGDKVITTGGMHGVISAVKDKTVTLQVDTNVQIDFTKAHIATVMVDNQSPPSESTSKKASKTTEKETPQT